MWEPDPSWEHLPGASGPSSAGLWVARRDDERWWVKRLVRPDPGDRARSDPRHTGYWRREAEVALEPAYVDGPGLVPPRFGAVEEDEEGITIWSAEVPGEPPSAHLVAHALGRFAAAERERPAWAVRDQLGDRLTMALQRGGWPTLARTTLADVTDRLWVRRRHWLDRVATGPQGRMHGDAAPGNFLAARGEEVVACDWQSFGTGPVGTDLGYYALSCPADFADLLDAFLAGVGSLDSAPDPAAILLAARVCAVYTVLGRAEWALARVAPGEGALAGKFRHPAVAPHLRAVERQSAQIEALLR